MSDVTDWLAAAGGIVGAIGGPAGLWAAWNQHQANKRRRNGPPAELVSVLAKVIEIADTVTYRYRDESWLDGSGLQSAKERLSELNHLVVDQWLSAMITVVGAEIGLVLGSVTSPSDSPEQRASTVAKQTRDAVELKSHAQRGPRLLGSAWVEGGRDGSPTTLATLRPALANGAPSHPGV